MAIINVRHVTTYQYRRAVTFGPHRLMFRPRPDSEQRLLEASLRTEPAASTVDDEQDAYGNVVTTVRFDRAASVLRFVAELSVENEVTADAPDPATLSPRRGAPAAAHRDALAPFLEPRTADADGTVARFAAACAPPPDEDPTGYRFAVALTRRIRDTIRYRPRPTAGTLDPADTLRDGEGCCRDTAVLLIEAARRAGLPARFVSGYVATGRGAVSSASTIGGGGGPNGADGNIGGGATHAWAQIHLRGHGWLDLDPTNGIIGARDLARVSLTPDERGAVPLAGTFFGADDDCLGMMVAVRTTTTEAGPGRIANAPATTGLPPATTVDADNGQGTETARC